MRANFGLLVALVAFVVRLVLRVLGLTGRVGGRLAGPPVIAGASRLESAGYRAAARGSGVWFSVALVVSALRVLSRLGARKRQVVWRGEVLPGQTLEIRHLLEDRAGRAVRPPR